MPAKKANTPQSLSQQAYAYIQERIVSGKLQIGTQLSEQRLAEELNISRTPVREAIRQLQLEGLVEQVSRFGTIVRTPDRRELEESYEVREALESFAVAQASRRTSPADLGKARLFVQEMLDTAALLAKAKAGILEGAPLQRFLAADLGFHMALLQAAGNSQIVRLVNASRIMARIFGTARARHDRTVVADTCRQHQAILTAVERGDAEAASRLMAEHIESSKRITLESHDRLQAQSIDATLGLPLVLLDEIDQITRNGGR